MELNDAAIDGEDNNGGDDDDEDDGDCDYDT